MRRIELAVLAGLTFAVTASAQWRDRDYERDRDYGGYRDDRYSAGVVERAVRNLEHARSYRWADHHERDHIEDARRDLVRFQENWRRGRFDRDRLDGAIENLNHLARADQVHPRDRAMFARDRDALRAFRSQGGYSRDRDRGRIRPWPY